MKSLLVLTVILSMCIARPSFAAAPQTTTLHIQDYNDAVFVISLSDYKSSLTEHLGGKAPLYLHFIDSITSISHDSIIQLDKGYCTSLPFYELDDYQKLDHALMSSYLSSKMNIIKGGALYNFSNSTIKKRKTRICNRPLGWVTGVNWVIKDSNNNSTIVELNKSKTRHAYKLVSCF